MTELAAVAVTSCALTSTVWYQCRRRRLRRLLRKASAHADPDRRLSALFVAALDGLRHHIDLVVECALTEEADVVLSSLVDLVMEAQWRDGQDGRVTALRAWAEEFVAERRQSGRPGVAPSRGHSRPFNSIDVLELTECVAAASPEALGPSSKRSRVTTWVRCGGVPEIDALEVIEVIEVIEGLVRESGGAPSTSGRASTRTAPTPFAAHDSDGSFEALVAEVRAGRRFGGRAATRVRSHPPASPASPSSFTPAATRTKVSGAPVR